MVIEAVAGRSAIRPAEVKVRLFPHAVFLNSASTYPCIRLVTFFLFSLTSTKATSDPSFPEVSYSTFNSWGSLFSFHFLARPAFSQF